MSALPFRSATDLAALIKKKQIGSEELLDLYLDRFEKYTPRVNAVIATDIPAARRRAKAADAALAASAASASAAKLALALRELKHRTVNNLQTIMATLNVEMRATNDPAVRQALQIAEMFHYRNIGPQQG